VGAELFHAEGQTDIMMLIVTFHNFVNVPKNNTNYLDEFYEVLMFICFVTYEKNILVEFVGACHQK
jgi:hypothetical protein